MPLSVPLLKYGKFSIALLTLAVAPSFIQAATLYWDTNGPTAGAGNPANGNWNTSTALWSTSAAGDVATSVYVAQSDAVFSAGSDAATASVSMTSAVTANSVTFKTGGVTIGNTGTNTLTVQAGGITVANGAGPASISRLTLGSAAATTPVTLDAAGDTDGSVITLGTAAAVSRSGIILFRGNNLGINASGAADSANVFFGTAPALTGSGAVGTSSVGIISRAIGDTSVSGTGAGFVTCDANGVRLLTAGEYSSTVAAGTNVRITGSETNSGTTTVNSLFMD